MVSFILLRLLDNPHHGVNLLEVVSDEVLDITNKLVDVSFTGSLDQDILVVVISETPRHLLVVHLGFVLALAPPDCHLVRINHSELPTISRPTDDVLTLLVTEKLQQELPQLDGSGRAEARTLGSAGVGDMVAVGWTEGGVG